MDVGSHCPTLGVPSHETPVTHRETPCLGRIGLDARPLGAESWRPDFVRPSLRVWPLTQGGSIERKRQARRSREAQ